MLTRAQTEKALTLRESRSASGPGHRLRKHFCDRAVVPTGAVRTAIEAFPKTIAQDTIVKKNGFSVVRLVGE